MTPLRYHPAMAIEPPAVVAGEDSPTRHDEPGTVKRRELNTAPAIGGAGVMVDDPGGCRGRRLSAQVALRDVAHPGIASRSVALVGRPLRSLKMPAAIVSSAAQVSAVPSGASPATAAMLSAGNVRMTSMAVGTPITSRSGGPWPSSMRSRRHAKSVLRVNCAASAAAYTGQCAQANVS